MTQRNLLGAFALGASTLVVSLAGCGGFSADPTGSGGAAVGSGGTASGGAGTSSGGDTTAGSGGREEVPEATCENVTACAGDPAGTWFAMKSCLKLGPTADLSLLGIGCTEATLEGTMTVDGNFKIGADGSIADNTKTVADLTLELPAQCLMVSGTVTQCNRIGSSIGDASGANIDLNTADCVDSTVTEGGCTCTVHFDQAGAMAYPQGRYAKTEGTSTNASNVLTVTGTVDVEDTAAPGPEELQYNLCVNGSFLHVTPSTPSTIFGLAKGDIVLQRQE